MSIAGRLLKRLRSGFLALTISAGVLGLAGLLVAASSRPAFAQTYKVSSSVQYELIDTWDVDKLNTILTTDFPRFAGIKADYSPAKNAVRLYRVTYRSVVPEQNNRPVQASGLVAIPDLERGTYPLVSYQHGTVYGKEQAPSQPDNSPETQLMLAQFAAQGYIVIGADYFGMGQSPEPEGYLVKGSHQQATVDMLFAARSVLQDLGLEANGLFLAGWSQGGYVTTALLERLEQIGVPVTAAATASAPIDLAVAMMGPLNFPRKIDASWIGITFILSAFSFENYYSIPGLAASVIQPQHYDAAKAVYQRDHYDPADIPTGLKELIRPEMSEPSYFQASAFGRLIAQAEAYRRVIQVPMRNYYGETDEAIPAGLARLAMVYQQSLGKGNDTVEAISTGNTDHRGTYAVAVPQWKAWFDGFGG